MMIESYPEADIRTMLTHVERGVTSAASIFSRLDNDVESARRSLTIAILAERDYHSAWGVEVCRAVYYCLLKRDWGNLAKLADESPGMRTRLSTILHLTDRDWDELRSCKPLVECPYTAAQKFVKRLVSVR